MPFHETQRAAASCRHWSRPNCWCGAGSTRPVHGPKAFSKKRRFSVKLTQNFCVVLSGGALTGSYFERLLLDRHDYSHIIANLHQLAEGAFRKIHASNQLPDGLRLPVKIRILYLAFFRDLGRSLSDTGSPRLL